MNPQAITYRRHFIQTRGRTTQNLKFPTENLHGLGRGGTYNAVASLPFLRPAMRRRQLLQSLGGTVLSFPWLSNLALRGAEVATAPRRLVCVGLDFGLRPESFFPAGQGPDMELTPLLEPLERWRNRLTVFSQLEHPGVQGGHYGVHAFLSGVRREQAAGFKDGCQTIDQLAEEHLGGLTRFLSLCLGAGPIRRARVPPRSGFVIRNR